MKLSADDPLAVAVTAAIKEGCTEDLRQLLSEHEDLATARIVDAAKVERTLLHVASDWPGHFANGAQTVHILAEAGADLDAKVVHPDPESSPETPLHWAASSNDVAVLDALLDCGASIEAAGAVFTGGTPMSDAVIFANWDAARRLLQRGAKTTMWQAAGLGRLELVESHYQAEQPSPEVVTSAFWTACMAGQQSTAAFLLEHGAELNWIGYDDKTSLDVAMESQADELVEWLRCQGAQTAAELTSADG